MSSIRKSFLSAMAIIVMLSTASVHAEQWDKFKKPHEPFTAYGMQVRMSIVNPINRLWEKDFLPTVFQEVAPCRLTSTLLPDRYDHPWGGPAYSPNEQRAYPSRGVLETVKFVNPCSEQIPLDAIGIVGRFEVTPGDGDGEVRIDANNPLSPDATTVADKPVTVPNFMATVCKALGLDPMKQNQSNVGRPIRLVEPTAQPIKEVLV